MDGPLQRLYQAKLTNLALLLVLVGLAVMALARLVDRSPGWPWLAALPLSDVGSSLFIAGFLGIALQYLDQRDGEERANQRLRKVLSEEAPAIRDAVIDGFAFSPEALTAVSSPDTLDRVIRNCLALRLGDAPMASDLQEDLQRQAMAPADRQYDSRLSVTLAPWPKGPSLGDGAMFMVTIRREARVTLSSPVLRFACVSDNTEYRELLRDPATTDVWLFAPVAGLDADDAEAFQLLEVAIDGRACPLRRTARRNAQTVAARVGDPEEAAGSTVHLSYTYRVLVQRHSHLLYLDVSRPTKGLEVELWYRDCGIRYVNALEFLAGPQTARMSRLPRDPLSGNITISYDGWVFPKSGVAFVWVLDGELDQEKQR